MRVIEPIPYMAAVGERGGVGISGLSAKDMGTAEGKKKMIKMHKKGRRWVMRQPKTAGLSRLLRNP